MLRLRHRVVAAALGAFGLAGAARAYETDQLTRRDEPLKDVRVVAYAEVNRQLVAAATNEALGCHASTEELRRSLGGAGRGVVLRTRSEGALPRRGRMSRHPRPIGVARRVGYLRAAWAAASPHASKHLTVARSGRLLPQRLARVFGVDAYRCPGCGDRLVLRSLVVNPPATTKILRGLERAQGPP